MTVRCCNKTARQMTRRDYETYDYLIAMDHTNLLTMRVPKAYAGTARFIRF